MTPRTFGFGPWLLDGGTRTLRRGAQPVHLTPKAFDLLALLIERRPNAVSKEDIHACVWPGTFVSDATVASVVFEVRAALNERARAPRFIRTVPKFGYAFVADVTPSAGQPACVLTLGRRVVPLATGEHVIGRSPAAAIHIDSIKVSRRHARIVVDSGRVTIEDLGSSNGTYVRGRRIAGVVPLSDGDTVRFGATSGVFRIDPEDATERLTKA